MSRRYDTEYRVGTDTTPAERGLKGLVLKSRRVGVEMASSLKPASGAAGGFATALGPGGVAGSATLAAASLAGMAIAARSVVAEASEIAKVADEIGVSTKFLQEYRYVTSLYGVSANDASKSLEQFNKRTGEALTGTGNLARILAVNNVEIKDAKGNIRSTNDLLKDYAGLIANASSQQEKAYLATEAFGRSGLRMINVLQGGREEFQKNIKAAHDLGVAIDDDLIRKSEVLDDRWTAFTTRFSTLFKNASLIVVSEIDKLSSSMNQLGEDSLKMFTDPSFRNFHKLLFGAELTDRALGKTDHDKILNDVLGNSLKRGFQDKINAALVEKTKLPEKPGSKKGGSKSKSRSASASAAKLQAERIAGVTSALQFELEQMNRTAEQQAIHNQLRSAGVDISSKAGQRIAGLVAQLEQEKNALEQGKIAREEYNKRIESARQSHGYLVNESLNALESVVSKTEKAGDAVKRLALQFALAAIQAKFLGQGPLAGLFGGGSKASGDAWAGLRSFEGGGFTGHGSRSGGVDGRGGFLAINHPNETMIDHTKGFGMPSMPASANNNQPQRFIFQIEATSDFDVRVKELSVNTSAQLVKAASPAIINQAVAQGQKNAADGGLDGVMSGRYSSAPKTAAR